MFEAVLPVPSDELLVRAVCFSHRHQQASAAIDHAADALLIVCLSRHQDSERVIEPDQPSIEHPGRCSGQGKTVSNDVGSASFDRVNMCSLHLGSPATVDELQARDGAAFIIGAQDDPPEHAVPNDPRYERSNPAANAGSWDKTAIHDGGRECPLPTIAVLPFRRIGRKIAVVLVLAGKHLRLSENSMKDSHMVAGWI